MHNFSSLWRGIYLIRNLIYDYSVWFSQLYDHVILGYRAVVCGMDPVCSESSSWMEVAHVAKLTRGPDQPFYQV